MRSKGVVVEISNRNHVIVMTSHGEFVRIPFKKQVCVGQEVEFVQKERISIWQLSVAAVLFVALIGSWTMWTNYPTVGGATPAFVVTLDINPSIELGVSEEHRVLSVDGLNKDGGLLLSKVDVIGQDLRLALQTIGERAKLDGYLNQGQSEVIVTIADSGNAEASLVELKNSRTGKHSELERVIVEAFTATSLAQVRIWQVPARIHEEARLAGITPSRYIAIENQAQSIIPQRIEARLTMREVTEEDEPTVTRTARAESATVSFGSTSTPMLAPVRWTSRSTAKPVSQRTYDLPFSVGSRVKGDFNVIE